MQRVRLGRTDMIISNNRQFNSEVSDVRIYTLSFPTQGDGREVIGIDKSLEELENDLKDCGTFLTFLNV